VQLFVLFSFYQQYGNLETLTWRLQLSSTYANISYIRSVNIHEFKFRAVLMHIWINVRENEINQKLLKIKEKASDCLCWKMCNSEESIFSTNFPMNFLIIHHYLLHLALIIRYINATQQEVLTQLIAWIRKNCNKILHGIFPTQGKLTSHNILIDKRVDPKSQGVPNLIHLRWSQRNRSDAWSYYFKLSWFVCWFSKLNHTLLI